MMKGLVPGWPIGRIASACIPPARALAAIICPLGESVGRSMVGNWPKTSSGTVFLSHSVLACARDGAGAASATAAMATRNGAVKRK
jgi:hypothetical protein